MQKNFILKPIWTFRLLSFEEVITYSRQLYSDPSHGKLGCQSWDGGRLKVQRAVYNENGSLTYLEANFFRVCTQTAAFPPKLPGDNVLPVEVENIEKYTYHASWLLNSLKQEK